MAGYLSREEWGCLAACAEGREPGHDAGDLQPPGRAPCGPGDPARKQYFVGEED